MVAIQQGGPTVLAVSKGLGTGGTEAAMVLSLICLKQRALSKNPK